MPRLKVAVVTGGSRGIGRGICHELARVGWTIVINFHQNESAANQTKDEVEKLGAQGHIFQADISNKQDRSRVIQFVNEHIGRVDLLVNNAGVAPKNRTDILDLTEASYDRVMATNLKGSFFLTQLFAQLMIQYINDGIVTSPAIVNIGSISATAISINRAGYCISKAALGMTTMLWATRLAEYGISVFELRPGIIDTDMTSAVRGKYDRLILKEGLTPIRRWGKPEDIGKAVRAIAEGLFPFSTGEVIYIDGGFHIQRL